MILTDSHTETKIVDALARGVRGYLLLGCSVEGERNESVNGIKEQGAGAWGIRHFVQQARLRGS
jgi:DNA-binding NarL/FixJ family response regulator